MTNHPQQQNSAQDNYYADDEIELIDLLRVLWKWKWMIILITLVCIVAAGVVSFMMPKIYKVSTAIEPGIIGMEENGSPIYLDSAGNMKAKIESGVYNSQILKNLNIDSRKIQIKFKVTNPKSTDLIKISSEWTQDQIATGTKVLEQLLVELSHDYKDIIQAKTEGTDKEILFKLSDIQGKKNQIEFKQVALKNIKAWENELNRKLMTLNDDTKKIKQQRDKILEGKTGEDSILSLFYLTSVQQNMVNFNQLNYQLNELTSKENKMSSEVEQLKQDMNDINTEIDRLNIEKSYIEHIKLISKPEASTSPIKPKKELNIALAGVVGFMLAVFIAFFAEYIKKSKEKSTTQHQQ
ncbi:MAG: Wzz/FepE/Etk N-terminal domain-containing protein [Deltaproteobacteria bacterium]|jgi:capsular polysaccharide biosynthesis protein|nr:Wzz/FepE/Etk N-terminal domain-containing protein [Deltaproteobacteria bacterium]